MSGLSTHTRDGSPSIAFMLEEREQPAYGTERVDVATAAAWAKANGIKTDGPGSRIARINSARFAAKLPSFVIVPDRPGDAPIMAKPASKAAPARAAAQSSAATPTGAVVSLPPPVVPSRSPGPRTIASEAELIDMISDYDGTVTVRCGKDLAGWLWALNTSNRPLQSSQVERHRKLLRDGEFVQTGEPFIISRQGTINDGQHRIRAILDTGIEATVDIRFGIERSAFAATGTGARRTLGNVLSIAGRPHASRLAAIARLLSHYDGRTMARCNQTVEPHLVLAAVEREEHLPAIAAWNAQAKFAPARTAPIGLVLAVAARLHPLDRVLKFAALVESGQADDADPARLLHVRLRDSAMSRERLHQADVAALAMKGWNAWVIGKQLHHLRLEAVDRTSEGFPQVVTP